jgi:hypothetical protein
MLSLQALEEMSSGSKRMPKRTYPSLYGGRGEQELYVEEPADREEEPARTEEPARSSHLRQRRLEFVTLTRTTWMTTTRDGGSCCGGGGGDDDVGCHDVGCHDIVGSSSGLRKAYERGPSMLPTQKPLPHQRKVIAPVMKE